MRKGIRTSVMVVSCLGAAVVYLQVAAAEESGGAGTGHSITDSPYSNGPPPITGGYTDTSQGGAKGSGDPQALPPSSTMRGQKQGSEQQGSDSHQQGAAQKPPDGNSGN